MRICSYIFSGFVAFLSLAVQGTELPGDRKIWADFLVEFKKAHEAKNLEAILALSHWEGVTPATENVDRRAIEGSLRMELASIRIDPWDPENEFLIERTFRGTQLVGNLDPVAQLRSTSPDFLGPLFQEGAVSARISLTVTFAPP